MQEIENLKFYPDGLSFEVKEGSGASVVMALLLSQNKPLILSGRKSPSQDQTLIFVLQIEKEKVPLKEVKESGE